jgi:hypothetical protein
MKVRYTFAKTADFVLNVRTAVQGVPPAEALDRVQGKIVPLGQRFHGSDSSFPFSSYIGLSAPAASFDQPSQNISLVFWSSSSWLTLRSCHQAGLSECWLGVAHHM